MTILKGGIGMKYRVTAEILKTGVKVSTKVTAASTEEAELAAGRRFLEAGFKGDEIKVISID